MTDQIAICSLAFGWKYEWRQQRLKETVQDIYGYEHPIFFHTNTLPPGARSFNESLYGFKPHCILEALNAGYKRIAWIDCTAVLLDKLEYYDQFIPEHGILAVQDDNKLSGFCSSKALQHMNIRPNSVKSQKYLSERHLVGGSFYYFDFNNQLCNIIFKKWIESEKAGLFGSIVEECGERLQGHRADETMMSLFLYESGSKPFTGATRYNWEKGGVILKQHFK